MTNDSKKKTVVFHGRMKSLPPEVLEELALMNRAQRRKWTAKNKKMLK